MNLFGGGGEGAAQNDVPNMSRELSKKRYKKIKTKSRPR